MQFHVPLDALTHRCKADERKIPAEFVAGLSENQKALFDALCPHLRVLVADLHLKIAQMDDGRRMRQMMEQISVQELHSILPLVQAGLAEALGVSTWTISKFSKAVVQMTRWPARQYSGPAKKAALLDRELADARRDGTFEQVNDVAIRLYQHLQLYSGVHLCGAVENFRSIDQGIRELEEEKEKKRKRRFTSDLNMDDTVTP